MVATEPKAPEMEKVDPAHRDDLAHCLALIARTEGRLYSINALKDGIPLEGGMITTNTFFRCAARAGFKSELVQRKLEDIPGHVLPAILVLKDGGAALLIQRSEGHCRLLYPEGETGRDEVRAEAELAESYTGQCLYLKDMFESQTAAEEAVEELSGDPKWFSKAVFRYKALYSNAIFATLLINIFSLASTIYIMNIYDRVVPNGPASSSTLWALAIFVTIVYVFDAVLKIIRARLLDTAGKRSDIIISSSLFYKLMNMRIGSRPKNSGSFASVFRDFDSVRDFFSSSTITFFADLPFVFIAIFVMWYISGPLIITPIIAGILTVIIMFISHHKMKKLSAEQLKSSAYKHGMLVEAISILERIKLVRAQGWLMRRWERATAEQAIQGQTLKDLSSNSMFAVGFIHQMATVVIVIHGVFLIWGDNGHPLMTQGALVASVILLGKVLAPLSQVTGLMGRLNSTQEALKNVGEFMAAPVERPPDGSLCSRPVIRGNIKFENVSFAYPSNTPGMQMGAPKKALDGVTFEIKPGERVGILGRVGSGKSTTLRLISGLYDPTEGRILMDGTDLRQIDPADLRSSISFVPQMSMLFNTSIRENLLMANPAITQGELQEVLELTGAIDVVTSQPQGLDRQVGEQGQALSGGQRDMLSTAMGLVNRGNLLLLDEPGTSLDQQAEQRLLAGLNKFSQGRTLVLCTHRPNWLGLVNRLIIIDGGKIVADGPRDQVLAALNQNSKRPADGSNPQTGN